ncbi:FtsX-like permease family protein [Pseudonocardia sp. N23]|uniref:ABC transporter permease n=1 Tax=Pseudonocardia sp. N23 TaxID=1987376 RepID=UPI000BFE9D87|nr:FtsX-like permease family protein [Pseudonocardia sp. N23]GAY09314.1 putative ABC transport system transmembrane protein [Pseudonocardia sp. N23]
MFVAWRDLRFARGRFALMGAVVVLITMLVGLLSGLTAGLARDSTSAISQLPADHLVFSTPPGSAAPSFTSSTIDVQTRRAWAQTPGVTAVEPLGLSTTRAEASTATAVVTAVGIEQASRLGPDGSGVAPGTVTLSDKAADDLGAGIGSTVSVAGLSLDVVAISGDASYSHVPVMWTNLDDWQRLSPGSSPHSTVLAVTTEHGADLAAADTRLGTTTLSRADALSAIGSYTSENGSLQLMRGFLFAISALVIGAFFTVWTIQRSGDIAVLKALGASTGYLLRDALGQATVLLVGGTAIGIGVAAGLGTLATDTVPFVLDAATVLLPGSVTIVLGVLGAALSIRRITAVDPLTALSAR